MTEASLSTTSASVQFNDGQITEGALGHIYSEQPSVFAKEADHFADEASLYDRQIRLWGLEAQNR